MEKKLSIEEMQKWVNDENEGLFKDEGERQFLKACRIAFPVSKNTVHSWMTRQGGRYESTRKDFYTDKHEEQTEYRKEYCEERIELEKRMVRQTAAAGMPNAFMLAHCRYHTHHPARPAPRTEPVDAFERPRVPVR